MGDAGTDKRADLKLRLTGLAAWSTVQFLGGASRLKVLGLDRVGELARAGRRLIVTCWHGQLLLCVYALRNHRLCAFVSPSRDGDMLSQVFGRFGWDVVRGSSSRAGVGAMMDVIKRAKAGRIIAWVPDGPKGPAKEAQLGIIHVARAAGALIVPMGAAARPKCELRTWDRHLLPLPLGRAAVACGEPLSVPDDATDEQLKAAGKQLEEAINSAAATAEASL